jgi:chromosome segregation ATPase
LIVFLYGAYQDIGGPNSYAAQAARIATLTKSLQQAQHERDEAKHHVAAVEAQKSTLIGWLQQAQHERDEARQELAQLQKQMKAARSTPRMMTYPVPEKRQPDPQVCAYLLQQLANAPQAEARNQQQPVEHEMGGSLEEEVRSVMRTVGCLPDETIR